MLVRTRIFSFLLTSHLRRPSQIALMDSPSSRTRSKFSSSSSSSSYDVDSLLSPKLLEDDGKRSLPTSGWGKFLGYVGVVTPIYLTTVLPVMIGSQIVTQLSTKLLGSGGSDVESGAEGSLSVDDVNVSSLIPLNERAYDVVILGFTGFTGRLAAAHLAKAYQDGSVKWAVAGRNLKKVHDTLASVAEELDLGPDALKNVGIIECDTSDNEAVTNMCKQTRVVCSTAGPFAKYGTPVVAACARTGTSYADITGETEWVKSMIMKYGDVAKSTGARILSLCGHDSVPWDCSSQHLAGMLEAKGEKVKKIVAYDEVAGAPSGGTIATIVHAVSTLTQGDKFAFDPLLATEEGTKSSYKVVDNNIAFPKRIGDKYLGAFVMAACNVQAVKKSMALRYGDKYEGKLAYTEGSSHPDFKSAFCTQLELFMGMSVVLSAPLRAVAIALGGVPKPGQGPSKKQMERGWLRVHMVAEGDKGSAVESVIYYPRDAGYRDTARMLVESGLCMALQPDKIKCSGGVMTPGYALSDLLIERLKVGGTKFASRDVKVGGASKL